MFVRSWLKEVNLESRVIAADNADVLDLHPPRWRQAGLPALQRRSTSNSNGLRLRNELNARRLPETCQLPRKDSSRFVYLILLLSLLLTFPVLIYDHRCFPAQSRRIELTESEELVIP